MLISSDLFYHNLMKDLSSRFIFEAIFAIPTIYLKQISWDFPNFTNHLHIHKLQYFLRIYSDQRNVSLDFISGYIYLVLCSNLTNKPCTISCNLSFPLQTLPVHRRHGYVQLLHQPQFYYHQFVSK